MENNEKKYVKMIKTCVGNLRISFFNPTTQASYSVVFQSTENEKVLSLEVASLIYADTGSGAYKAFKNGYFTFDDIPAIRNFADKRGLLMGELDFEPEVPNYADAIIADLKSGSKERISAHFDTPKHQEDLVRVARENRLDLTKGTIDYITKTLKVTIEVDEE